MVVVPRGRAVRWSDGPLCACAQLACPTEHLRIVPQAVVPFFMTSSTRKARARESVLLHIHEGREMSKTVCRHVTGIGNVRQEALLE
jgi:hypothetical protein